MKLVSFLFLLLQCIFSVAQPQDSTLKKGVNAIIYFDLVVPNYPNKQPLWEDLETGQILYFNEHGSARYARTVDSLLSFTIARLEEECAIRIEPVYIATSEKQFDGNITGLPKYNVKAAAKSGYYNRMFVIKARLITYNTKAIKINYIPLFMWSPTVSLQINIYEYNKVGEIAARYNSLLQLDEILDSGPLSGDELYSIYKDGFILALSRGNRVPKFLRP